MSAWNAGQARMFAKQIAEKYGASWFVLVDEIRNTILSHHVLMVVFSVRGTEAISVDDMRELRIMIEERLAKHHNLKIGP